MKTRVTEKETKAEDIKESNSNKSDDLSHFKDQFEELSIKDLRLIKDMVQTTLDMKTAMARHEHKFAPKNKKGSPIIESSQYREPDEEYI